MCCAKSHIEAEAVNKDLVESVVWSPFLFESNFFILLAFNMNTAINHLVPLSFKRYFS